MSITIRGDESARIHVTGDIACILDIPPDPDDDRFVVALSEGTLIQGEFAEEQICRLRVQRPGAAIIETAKEGEHDVLVAHWDIAWVNVGTYHPAALRLVEDEGTPLFPELSAVSPEYPISDDEVPW